MLSPISNESYYFDSHAHLTSPAMVSMVDDVLSRASEAGVKKLINICTDSASLEQGILLAKRYAWVYTAASTPPHDVEEEGETFFPIVEQHAMAGHLVAIGETGLDYHYYRSSAEAQKYYLRKYLQLARQTHLPVVIHCREAFKDFFSILDEEYIEGGKHGPGVLHCFTGTLTEAKEVVERGWYLSLSGIATFKKSEDLRQVAKMVPLEQLLIETDSPYLAPQSKRGRPNEPAYLAETAQILADVKDISIDTFRRQTAQNACVLFKLKEPSIFEGSRLDLFKT
ncbi:TatD family hydrolase [Parachlamydia sp. AcF125]|uniref:TatD family hydrolase n=1 Tax=Parachlamydia sp. AcF125 TaxID=2795736 RepID=UPI001BD7FCF1|nr:TatD family hydrolase [Parachlamydia sp. AcF125]MBS4167739.1 D-aminoacyl-tRNA deacylase [Parachlamydia sp. AcF125]